jgi:hypothetical protein
MMINKGVLQADKSYVYICHACGFKNADCPYCYGKNLERCQAEIRTTRGQRYYALLKTILTCVGRDIYLEGKRIIDAQGGKLFVVDIGYLSLKFNLNFKATCEWVEEIGIVPAGTHDRIIHSKFKVRDLYDAASKKYELTSTT